MIPNQHGYCPKCNADLDGEVMMDSWRRLYPEKTEEELLKWFSCYCPSDTPKEQLVMMSKTRRWGRQIGLETPYYDGVSMFACPDCKHVWKRSSYVSDEELEKATKDF